MKPALILLPLFAVALLAACGGEGGPPSPNASPTQVPNVCLPNPDPAAPFALIIARPLPFDAVTSPLTVSGRIAAFEGTYQVAIFDADGKPLVETFGTGQASEMGELGDFSIDLEFQVDDPTPVCLWVYEASARDGSPIHVRQVPLLLMPSPE